ncbi:MAG: aspartate--tRNA ligase [Acidimicrobiia bacterium]
MARGTMMAGPFRTSTAGSLDAAAVGTEVVIAGWIQRRRDHGGVVFVDLRDATGIIQVVLNPEDAPADADVLHGLRMEFCIKVVGTVRLRPEGTVNPHLPTGAIEVAAREVTVLSAADPLPFPLDERTDIDEALRLRYRYLDLRRDRMAANLKARSAAIRAMRTEMDDRGFLEVETPTLIASTPEGARDMLVPSRLRKGQFYALPQSPQLFKQLLMIGGVDRYYQIAKCYRDEDFRADRQVEFAQLDFEGAFWGQEEVLETIEAVAKRVVAELRGSVSDSPFTRMTWSEATQRYGTDKPDLRFAMEIRDLSHIFSATAFRAFGEAIEAGGSIRGINAGPLGLARSGLDDLVATARAAGAKGLVWMVAEDDGSMRSPISKFLSEPELAQIRDAFGATPGDTLLIVADQTRTVLEVLGLLRLHVGKPDGHDDLAFVLVVDFPVFDIAEDGSLTPAHHPFTAPADVEDLVESPESAVSKAYDLVLNGTELGSGSVRIHDAAVQQKVFEVMGISETDADRRFGWFLEALRYGTPPHAGFAIGIDRFVSILQNEPNIREIIPFPKTQTGFDPLTGSPSRVDNEQLHELGIRVDPAIVALWDDESDASSSAPDG